MSCRLDSGFGHALLLPAGGRAERLQYAEAGVEQNELVAGVHDWGVLLEHHIVGRQEIVDQHLLHFLIRHADEGALRRAERERSVGNHGHFRAAQIEAMPIGRLRTELGGLRQCAAAEHGRCAQTGAEREQGSSRNIVIHEFPPLFLEVAVMPPARSGSPDCLIVRASQAAPAFENWQEESVFKSVLGKPAAERCQGITPPKALFFRPVWPRSRRGFSPGSLSMPARTA